jgi:uncharacterized protein
VAKFLLLIALIAIVYALLRSSSRRRQAPPDTNKSEAMTKCAHCGVHFPSAESIREGERDYCCDEHRRLGVEP